MTASAPPVWRRLRLRDTPAVTVVLVVSALALVLVPMSRLLTGGAGAPYGLEPMLELMSVLLGLLVVAVSLHMLDPQEQSRANIVVFGFTVAALCNFLHGVMAYAAPVQAHGAALPAEVAAASGWFSSLARVAEAGTLALLVLRVRALGPARWWGGAAAGLALGLAWTATGNIPHAMAHALEGSLRQWLAAVLVVVLGLTAWQGLRRRPQAGEDRSRLEAGAAVVFMLGELAVLLQGGHGVVASPVAHALRVMGYALLYQAIFVGGIRQPYRRAREAEANLRDSEARLHLLGRNLPGSVLYQLLREPDGRKRFVHVGDAIERLNGVTAEALLQDPKVFYEQVLEEDRPALMAAGETSLRTMQPMDVALRLRRADGEVRWMRLSASPRRLEHGQVIWDGVQTDITAAREAQEAARAMDAQHVNMLRQVPGGVARLDRDLRILYVNDVQAAWLRTTVAAMEGQLLREIIGTELFVRLQPFFERAFAGERVVFENRLDYPEGPQYRQSVIAPEWTQEGPPQAVMFYAYDLTELKLAKQEVDRQKARLLSVMKAMPDMVFLKDPEGVYQACNPVFERLVGRREADLIGLTDFDLISTAEAERFRKYDLRAMQATQPLIYEETLTFVADGYRGQFETIKIAMRDAEGAVTGVLGVCRDITDRKRAEQEIERLAFYDPLTGLPNRRLLLDRLQRSIVLSQRTRQQGALLFIDLDNFKYLNDTLGHDMGDQLLSQVAARLVSSVRECDTVARFGGDEFVVMLENLSTHLPEAASQAETVAEKLLASLNQPFDLGEQKHYSTPSIGITLYGEQRLSVDELLKRADLAMYQAKAAGRNTQRFFDPDMQAAVNARSNLEADLRQGLTRGELLLYYQPIVDHQGKLTGAEALVRWRHPQRGMISPGEFIPLAEQTGLILPLGQYVLRTACEQLQRWSQQPATAGLNLSVNVSARQFRQPDFVRQVLGSLSASGAEPARLKLELTESLLLGDIEDTIVRMEQLKKEGVGFALDDFGTGYSSLSYLKRLPLDQVKIDQSFVRDVLADPNDAAIVRTILALAKSLDLEVVAEGVETAGQLGFLRLHGCEGFQGYLFGRPGPAEGIDRFLNPAM